MIKIDQIHATEEKNMAKRNPKHEIMLVVTGQGIYVADADQAARATIVAAAKAHYRKLMHIPSTETINAHTDISHVPNPTVATPKAVLTIVLTV